jgi:tRNA U34 2-thiouridine synthase MnmA/TrmU
MAKQVSIRDVAQRAGVSVTTVSHVLNETPGKRVAAGQSVVLYDASDPSDCLGGGTAL